MWKAMIAALAAATTGLTGTATAAVPYDVWSCRLARWGDRADTMGGRRRALPRERGSETGCETRRRTRVACALGCVWIVGRQGRRPRVDFHGARRRDARQRDLVACCEGFDEHRHRAMGG